MTGTKSLFEFSPYEDRIRHFGASSTVAIKAGEARKLLRALRAIAANAEAHHAGEDGKARALAVIAGWARQPSTVPPGTGIENACKCDDERLPWCQECIDVMNEDDDA